MRLPPDLCPGHAGGGFQRPQLANIGSHHCRGSHTIVGPTPHDPPLLIVMFLGKSKGNDRRRNICQKRLSERLDKQNMWRVYKHTGKDQDYEAYKEALNAATNEVRKSKRNFEHKLAQNIKSDSKSFYVHVRSKQNVRDKVGPLEDNFGNIVTQEFLMAEELNMHFSSVFTRKDTSSLPVPETKFKGSEIACLLYPSPLLASNSLPAYYIPLHCWHPTLCLLTISLSTVGIQLFACLLYPSPLLASNSLPACYIPLHCWHPTL